MTLSFLKFSNLSPFFLAYSHYTVIMKASEIDFGFGDMAVDSVTHIDTFMSHCLIGIVKIESLPLCSLTGGQILENLLNK